MTAIRYPMSGVHGRLVGRSARWGRRGRRAAGSSWSRTSGSRWSASTSPRSRSSKSACKVAKTPTRPRLTATLYRGCYAKDSLAGQSHSRRNANQYRRTELHALTRLSPLLPVGSGHCVAVPRQYVWPHQDAEVRLSPSASQDARSGKKRETGERSRRGKRPIEEGRTWWTLVADAHEDGDGMRAAAGGPLC